VIDLSGETEVTAITTGGEPYWVAISSDGSTVASSLHTDGVALIDGVSNTLLGVVAGVGSEPEAVAVNSDGSTVYVGDENSDALYVVDVASETVTGGPIDISASCAEPENMVISPDDVYLYITCASGSGQVIRVATSGFAITTIDDTGLSDPHGIALSPDGTMLYYTDGTDVFEWDTGSEALTGTTFTGCDMYGGRVSPDGSKLFCKEEFGDLMVYDTSDGSPLGSVSIGGQAVDVSGDGTKAYLPTGSVTEVVDVATVTDLPGSIAMSGDGGRGIAVAPVVQEPTPTPTPTPTVEPTPTPTQAPAQLPPTGTGPSGDGNGWPLVAVAMVLLGAGGVSAFALAKRRRG